MYRNWPIMINSATSGKKAARLERAESYVVSLTLTFRKRSQVTAPPSSHPDLEQRLLAMLIIVFVCACTRACVRACARSCRCAKNARERERERKREKSRASHTHACAHVSAICADTGAHGAHLRSVLSGHTSGKHTVKARGCLRDAVFF